MVKAGVKKLKLIILTVDRTVYEGEVDSVTGLGTDGEFTILPRHMAYMTPLEIGILTARSRDFQEVIALHSGFLRVEDDTVTVLADAAERAEDIDIERARAAKQKAHELLKKKPDSTSAALRRALLRLRVVDRL